MQQTKVKCSIKFTFRKKKRGREVSKKKEEELRRGGVADADVTYRNSTFIIGLFVIS